jgi:integrase
MSRPRTGTLEFRKGSWFLRFTLTIDGKSVRRTVNLHTSDKTRAEKIRREFIGALNAGEIEPDALAEVKKKQDTVTGYFALWNEPRIARGVRLAEKQASYFKHHVQDQIGEMKIGDVRPADIRTVFDLALGKVKRSTVVGIRAMLRTMFEQAYEAEIIAENPVSRAKVPLKKDKKKKRAILLDSEIEQLIACPLVPGYFRLMCFAARAAGGMRAGDVNSWDWQSIDRVHFAKCVVPRNKTNEPQELAMPPALAAMMRALWDATGQPSSGTIFPALQGKNKGKVRRYGSSLAVRLRAWLLVAGVDRHELHHETAHTKPVDFHSFRRAFATALADTGVNEQKAMRLTGHSSGDVHRRYVMETEDMKQIPERAVPQLSEKTLEVMASGVTKRPGRVTKRGAQ